MIKTRTKRNTQLTGFFSLSIVGCGVATGSSFHHHEADEQNTDKKKGCQRCGPAALFNLQPAYLGQDASISLSTVSRSAEPETQSVMPFQKEPAPTSAGIRSEPSKRKLVVVLNSSAMVRSS